MHTAHQTAARDQAGYGKQKHGSVYVNAHRSMQCTGCGVHNPRDDQLVNITGGALTYILVSKHGFHFFCVTDEHYRQVFAWRALHLLNKSVEHLLAIHIIIECVSLLVHMMMRVCIIYICACAKVSSLQWRTAMRY